MKCLILAAGYATRLYPLTANFPKPLLPVGGKPIIEWLIDDLRPVTEEFIVVTNHKFASLFNEWAENKDIKVIDDGTMTNETRLGAVRDIELGLRGVDEDVLVVAGDNLLDFSLIPFIEFARSKNASCVMCHTENDPVKQRKTAIITIDHEGLVITYEEKPTEPKGNLAVPPFYYFNHNDFSAISNAVNDGCNTDAPGSLAAWLSSKKPVYAWKMKGSRYDIGDMSSYLAVKDTYCGLIHKR